MKSQFSTALTSSLSVFFLAIILVVPSVAGSPGAIINKGQDDAAILGYDSVAYFTEGRAIKGNSEFTISWQDSVWHFASAKHRDLFAADPERYAPQFGGHCAMALTRGVTKVVNPEAWIISGGKLYLSFSKKGRDKFREDMTANIKKSEDNWAKHRKQQ